MSVIVKGMGFPTKENFMTQLYLICDKDGNWYAVDTTNKDLYKLIEVKEPHEIGYDDCANALLKMWMDNVLTDGEYYRIANKLNKKWGKREVAK